MALRSRYEVQRCRARRAAVGAVCWLPLIAGCADDRDDAQPEMAVAELSPREEANIVVATRVIEEGLAGGDVDVINALVRPDYIQHNAQARDGREGLLEFVAFLESQGGTSVTIHRKLADGDYVAFHSTYGTGDARQVAFDVFRLEDGQLAEHWDALQAWVEPAATVSGNTLVDGETVVTDRAFTEENRELVTRMVREVLVEGRLERLADYVGDTYIQHNPRVGNGLAAVQAFFAAVEAQGVLIGYTASPLVVADGNFVLVGSEGYLGDSTDDYTVFYDLFRVDEGELVEHWDVIQAVDQSLLQHDNGLF